MRETTGSKNQKFARCTFHHIAGKPPSHRILLNLENKLNSSTESRQIFCQSVQELQNSDTPKLPFPIDLLCRPYNSVRTAGRHCDNSMSVTTVLYLRVIWFDPRNYYWKYFEAVYHVVYFLKYYFTKCQLPRLPLVRVRKGRTR